MITRNVAIVCGGDSSEWVVSMKSAQGIVSFLKDAGYELYIITQRGKSLSYQTPSGELIEVDKNDFSLTIAGEKIQLDFAYITIHGTPGENGILQGYFDLIGIPYSCCGVMSASVTFNKFICNHLLKSFGFKIAASRVLRSLEAVEVATLSQEIGYPCFVKPNVGGSSFGTFKVKSEAELLPAITSAFEEAPEVIVEAFMQGTEVTCGCFQVEGQKTVLPITEVVSKNEFFDYDAKYNADQVEEITPARISAALTQDIQTQTARIYDVLACKGIIRVDFIIVEGVPHLLEVNTTPGMTATSFIPQQINAAGLKIGSVLRQLIEDAITNK